ncbi:MAG: DUF6266 family protein [Weeksellaceae bacterium]|nr:DUF6266 family protein [Weeksellaceae bacterium]
MLQLIRQTDIWIHKYDCSGANEILASDFINEFNRIKEKHYGKDPLKEFDGVASSATPAELEVTCSDNSGTGSALATDKALILAINVGIGEAVFTTEGLTRDVATATLILPSDYSSESLEDYLAFVSEDGTKVSNSVFLGSVTLA